MNENLKCNICLEDNNNIIIFRKCRHHICLSCLGKLNNDTCPYCRGKFDKEKFQIELTKEYLNSWYKYFSF